MKWLSLLFLCTALQAAEVPRWQQIPTWRKYHTCEPFSIDFAARCNKADVPAVQLTYDWAFATGEEGRHCVVLFKHEGKFWLMDNQHLRPWGPVKGRTDAEILRRYGVGFHAMVDNATMDPRRPRTIAELFPHDF